jgi:UDP-N-acetylmuramoylalanine--D-glutamate ligase
LAEASADAQHYRMSPHAPSSTGGGYRTPGSVRDRVCLVAGARVAGAAAARALLARGATVTVVDRHGTEAIAALADAGARVILTDSPDGGLLAGVTDVILSPGFAPHHPLAVAAVAAGLDVYSEPELAWRLRGPDAPPWLAVTGTNGKTTTRRCWRRSWPPAGCGPRRWAISASRSWTSSTRATT